MAITRVSQSTVKQGLDKSQTFTAGIPPILGKMYSIETITVGSGGTSSITFSSIPTDGTYKHLQMRGILYGANCLIRFNSDSTTTYRRHYLGGDGASTIVGSNTTTGLDFLGGSSTANVFNASIVDILDYADTTKYTTARLARGIDQNGSGNVWIMSGLWPVTTAISSVSVVGNGGNLAEFSTFALYGIKA